MKNIAVFASGSGSNAENIFNHFRGSSVAQVRLFLTENPSAYVLERAKRLGVRAVVFGMDEFRSGGVLQVLKEEQVDFIVLAGFLKLIPSYLIDAYPNGIVNIHPALLPKFGGKGMYGDRVHAAVIAAGERESGITIHYVNHKYDEGKTIFQASCPVLATDSAADLAQRVHELEYKHFPTVIERVLKG
ncbi:MAG: phosphoribosylglycinamide formyltransferase [Bacteroidales bacterium]|nr:phosphoribosylglycinamide formyltransferase [Bacteroidales bacterium]MBN2749616.1 phosphoribosylglycinamide formyltransferase [Bacteroidales bacterium]